jgi:hypothetical protein
VMMRSASFPSWYPRSRRHLAWHTCSWNFKIKLRYDPVGPPSRQEQPYLLQANEGFLYQVQVRCFCAFFGLR